MALLTDIPLPALNNRCWTRTLGPNITLGVNWFLYNFLNAVPNAGQAVQNSDGSVTLGLVADGSGYGGGICTARQVSSQVWAGTAFRGPMYLEIIARWTPTLGSASLPFPALWSDDILFLNQTATVWPGQAAGYFHHIEPDWIQWPHNALHLIEHLGLGDWYGPSTASVGAPQVTGVVNSEVQLAQSFSFSDFHKYAAYVNPASPGKTGSILKYIDDVLVSYAVGTPDPVSWPYWDTVRPPSPPPVYNVSCGSWIDQTNLAMIAGTDVTCPMVLKSWSIWQPDASLNITQ